MYVSKSIWVGNPYFITNVKTSNNMGVSYRETCLRSLWDFLNPNTTLVLDLTDYKMCSFGNFMSNQPFPICSLHTHCH